MKWSSIYDNKMTACMRTTNLVYIHGLKITSQLSKYKPNQNTGTKADGHSSTVSKQCKVIKVQAELWSFFLHWFIVYRLHFRYVQTRRTKNVSPWNRRHYLNINTRTYPPTISYLISSMQIRIISMFLVILISVWKLNYCTHIHNSKKSP